MERVLRHELSSSDIGMIRTVCTRSRKDTSPRANGFKTRRGGTQGTRSTQPDGENEAVRCKMSHYDIA